MWGCMFVLNMSFCTNYGCLKSFFKTSLVFFYIFCMLWMAERRISYIMDVLKTSLKPFLFFISFVHYGCFKNVFCMLWMFQNRLLYFMDVLKTSFVYVMDVWNKLFCIFWLFQKLSFIHYFSLIFTNWEEGGSNRKKR